MAQRVRVRARVAFAGPHGAYVPGQVYEVPAALARRWAAEGLIEYDKALDGPEEVKGRAKRRKGRRRTGE